MEVHCGAPYHSCHIGNHTLRIREQLGVLEYWKLLMSSSFEQNNNLAPFAYENDQGEFFILLCAKQKVILTSNLRLATSLVNGLIGKIVSLFYKETLALWQLPAFVVVNFYRYVGPPWDPNNPSYLPIPLIKRGDHIYIPLKMG